MKPRRVALVLLPITLAAALWVAFRSPRKADAFGLEFATMLRIVSSDGSRAPIRSVLLKATDPRAQTLLDVLRRHGAGTNAPFAPTITIYGGDHEVALDPQSGLVRTPSNEVFSVEAAALADALQSLSPELRAGLPANPTPR